MRAPWATFARRERKKKPAIPVGMTALKRSGPTLANTKGARVGHPDLQNSNHLAGRAGMYRAYGAWAIGDGLPSPDGLG